MYRFATKCVVYTGMAHACEHDVPIEKRNIVGTTGDPKD